MGRSSSNCPFCRAPLESTVISKARTMPGDVDELIALVATAVTEGEDTTVAADWLTDAHMDECPQVPLRVLTDFSIFDESFHLVRLDGDLLESGVVLNASGRVGAVESSGDSAGVLVSKLRILEWRMCSFGEKAGSISICTDAAEYWLHDASSEYSSFFAELEVGQSLCNIA